MKNEVVTGMNRTGADMSPIDKKVLVEAATKAVPSAEGDATAIDLLRHEYMGLGETIGSVPPPATVKGAAGVVMDAAKGAHASVFIDKLGERLAFERTGTRLYDALLAKFDSSEALPGGPTREELAEIRDEELAHFELVRQAMLELGADPTAVTPSADVTAVSSIGLLQVITDPRINLKQSLEAALIAELIDNDGWPLLIELASAAGHDDLAQRFGQALAEEAEHLINVRSWVKQATIADATVGTPS